MTTPATAAPHLVTCDYHDLPLVCGECGEPADFADEWLHRDFPFYRMHDVLPVHRIPDPEGIEGTAIVPCGEAG